MTNDPKREAVTQNDDLIAVPREVLAAANYIIRKGAHADSKTAVALRKYALGPAILALGSADVELPRLPRDKLLYGHPDYIDDPEGLERWRQSAKEGHGHDRAPININSLRRLIDTIERLRAALTPQASRACG